MLFAPDAADVGGISPFGGGLGLPGRYSSRDEGRGGGLLSRPLLGESARDRSEPLGAGGDWCLE